MYSYLVESDNRKVVKVTQDVLMVIGSAQLNDEYLPHVSDFFQSLTSFGRNQARELIIKPSKRC